MATLGSWNIDELKPCNLPQKAASAFTEITSRVVGADYMPVLYVGKQIVNGTNYCILAVQTLITANSPKRLVRMVIHESLDRKYSVKTIRGLEI